MLAMAMEAVTLLVRTSWPDVRSPSRSICPAEADMVSSLFVSVVVVMVWWCGYGWLLGQFPFGMPVEQMNEFWRRHDDEGMKKRQGKGKRRTPPPATAAHGRGGGAAVRRSRRLGRPVAPCIYRKTRP